MRAIKTITISSLAVGCWQARRSGSQRTRTRSAHLARPVCGAGPSTEPVDEEDPDATATGHLFEYERGFLFAGDEDWCRHALVMLDVEITDERVTTCLDWTTASPFAAEGEVVVLPETWAVRVAKKAGWYPDEAE